MMTERTPLRRCFVADVKHLALNLNLNLVTPIVFYGVMGFQSYGWSHLGFVALSSIWMYTLDDAIESRSYPIYVWPLIAGSLILQPVLSMLMLFGEVLINLKAILSRESLILELMEGPGNTLIFVAPWLMPLGVRDLGLWLAITGFVTYANASAHKIGHRESCNPRWSFIVGLAVGTLTAAAYGRWDLWYTWLVFGGTVALLIPTALIRWRYFYNFVWQSWAAPAVFIYFIQTLL